MSYVVTTTVVEDEHGNEITSTPCSPDLFLAWARTDYQEEDGYHSRNQMEWLILPYLGAQGTISGRSFNKIFLEAAGAGFTTLEKLDPEKAGLFHKAMALMENTYKEAR
ncbi:hypothetical protein FRC06_001361 [Ceratobasidium sp. 370]|nr:hypothetical protein FRC06_001361 [Ceratobasidium sp. 370]